MDGWNTDELYHLMTVLDDLESLAYELRNCVKGGLTGCTTYEELREYVEEKAEQLKAAAVGIDSIEDVEEDEGED